MPDQLPNRYSFRTVGPLLRELRFARGLLAVAWMLVAWILWPDPAALVALAIAAAWAAQSWQAHRRYNDAARAEAQPDRARSR